MDSEAHYNLGVILKSLDRSNEAEKSYRQAITLKPDYAEATVTWVTYFKNLVD